MIKLIGQLIGLFVGASLSPCWVLLRHTMKSYFDLDKAVLGPQQLLAEFSRFNAITEVHPTDVLYHLLPSLVVIILFSTLFVTACTFVCTFLTCSLAERLGFGPKPFMVSSGGSGLLHSPWVMKDGQGH